jgi:quinol-cytochrome oxidoreductase complex cytochrome b subunit
MSRIYWIFVIVMAALAIWGTEKSLAETTTIFAPNGTVTVCTTGQGMIICV